MVNYLKKTYDAFCDLKRLPERYKTRKFVMNNTNEAMEAFEWDNTKFGTYLEWGEISETAKRKNPPYVLIGSEEFDEEITFLQNTLDGVFPKFVDELPAFFQPYREHPENLEDWIKENYPNESCEKRITGYKLKAEKRQKFIEKADATGVSRKSLLYEYGAFRNSRHPSDKKIFNDARYKR